MQKNNTADYIEALVEEFVCDLNCPLNCCLDSVGGAFRQGEYERYKPYDGKRLIDGSIFRLKDSIEIYGNEIMFRQDDSGVCMFLKDGKCLIHASFGREVLHRDCREYPRWVFRYRDHVEKMLFPVCPQVTKIFLEGNLWFWDYMTKVVEPDPEGLFEKRREIILALKDRSVSLPETLERLCSDYGGDIHCSRPKQFQDDMEDIIRHLFACTVFCQLFDYGYDGEAFDGFAVQCLDTFIRAYDYLSSVRDLNRENIAFHFNRGVIGAYEPTAFEEQKDTMKEILKEAGIQVSDLV